MYLFRFELKIKFYYKKGFFGMLGLRIWLYCFILRNLVDLVLLLDFRLFLRFLL